MKVLVIGGYNYFSAAVLMRLKREKHNTYIICGKGDDKSDAKQKQKADVEYRFNASDSNISHIIDDIKPDSIIIMGAFDSIYKWEHFKSSNEYLRGLSNILGVAQDACVKKVVYLSSYALDQAEIPSKTAIAVTTGEDLCLRYNQFDNMKTFVLRMPSVFGIPTALDESCGELPSIISSSFTSQPCFGLSKEIDPLYISDAVEAIYKVICSSSDDKQVYELSSGYKLDTVALKNKLQEALADGNIAETDFTDTFKVMQDTPGFNSDYSFKPFMKLDMAIQSICKAHMDNNWSVKKTNKPSPETSKSKQFIPKVKEVITTALPYFENLLLFALAGYFIYKGVPNPALLLVFYIVLTSAVFNRVQMFIAIIVSVILYTLFQSSGYSLYQIVSNYNYIFTVLVMIVSGFIVSSLKDKLSSLQENKDFVIQTLEEEVSELGSMLRTSRDIKAELENRLLNHSDSLSKIYDIVSQLDAVETRKVFSGALKVVSDIMRSKDISIYMSGNNSSYFRNVASSTPKARESMSNSIKITDYLEMYDALKNENVYINRTLDPSLPIMALAVNTGNEFNVIIMLWSIDFKDLGLYHVNLFLVLRMIITSSIARAYQYELATHEKRYIEDTAILRKEYFAEILSDQKALLEETGSPFQVIKVLYESRDITALSPALSSSLRTTDYIGIGEDDSVMVILGGTTKDDVHFIEKRLNCKEIFIEHIVC